MAETSHTATVETALLLVLVALVAVLLFTVL
jgi:hypothetical protein